MVFMITSRIMISWPRSIFFNFTYVFFLHYFSLPPVFPRSLHFLIDVWPLFLWLLLYMYIETSKIYNYNLLSPFSIVYTMYIHTYTYVCMYAHVFRADHLASDNIFRDLCLGKTKNRIEMDIYAICYKKILSLAYGFPLIQTRYVNQLSNVLTKHPRQSNQKGKAYFGLMPSEVSVHSDLVLSQLYLWWCRISQQRICWPKLFTSWQPQRRKMRWGMGRWGERDKGREGGRAERKGGREEH